MEDKNKLCDALFSLYFEVTEENVLVKDFLPYFLKIANLYQKFKDILNSCLKDFSWFSNIETIKLLNYEETTYFVIKAYMYKYLVIDFQNKKSLSEQEVMSIFNPQFFNQNFSGLENQDVNEEWTFYHFLECKRNSNKIIEFYMTHQDIFDLPNKIYAEYQMGDAYTYLSMNLANNRAQLGFETLNQFLYEQLYLHLDLTPSKMQDAQNRMSKERMEEMFLEMVNIRIPLSSIPTYFFKEEVLERIRRLK